MDISAIRKLNFDVSTVCNHACNFCSNRDKRAVKARTSVIDFQRVMDNVGHHVNFNVIEEFGLSAKGEPLENKNFAEIVRLTKQHYGLPYVYISSNGSKLTPELARLVLEAGLDSIKFSINAISRDAYRVTHQKDEFGKVLKNLKHLIGLKKTLFPSLNILISCISNDTQAEIETLYQHELGDDYALLNGIWKRDLLFTPAKYCGDAGGRAITAKCNKPFDEVWLNADGHLLMCCMDYFSEVDLGNLLTDDFASLWNGPQMESIRAMHLAGDFPLDHICKRCLTFNKASDLLPL